jgi:hypothetical protein
LLIFITSPLERRRLSSRNDANGISAKSEGYDEEVPCAGEAGSLLAVLATSDLRLGGSKEWIEEDLARFLEGNAMPFEIRECLIGVPEELDILMDMENLHRWKG